MTVVTQEGLARRNTMHFRVKADIFVPAGGSIRPQLPYINTVSLSLWRKIIAVPSVYVFESNLIFANYIRNNALSRSYN